MYLVELLNLKNSSPIIVMTALVLFTSCGGNGKKEAVLDLEGNLHKVAGELGFTEGPAVDPEGTLYFTDHSSGNINRIVDGTLEVYYSDIDAVPNGLWFDDQGNLFICEGKASRVRVVGVDGSDAVLASEYEGKRFNSPNDIAVSEKGIVYFSDPYFGAPGDQPQPVTGLYAIINGKVILLDGDFDRPNGVGLSPDEQYLFVTNDNPENGGEIWRYEINEDGSVSKRTLFAMAGRIMDGMCFDDMGHLFVASFNEGGNPEGRGIWVFDMEGKQIGLIQTPEQPSNCTIREKTLYITASSSVFKTQIFK